MGVSGKRKIVNTNEDVTAHVCSRTARQIATLLTASFPPLDEPYSQHAELRQTPADKATLIFSLLFPTVGV